MEEMVVEFRKKGFVVPEKIMNDLKSARTMIKILNADPSCSETIQKIEEYLGNVESYLIAEGQKMFGAEYVDAWLKRLDEAGVRMPDLEEEAVRFVPGVPREHKWIRVKPSDDLPLEKLKRLAEESTLSYEVQSNGYLLIYGEEMRIKEFVRKAAIKR